MADNLTVRMWDYDAGQPVDVPEDRVEEAVISGMFGLPSSKKVVMLGPAGGRLEVAPEDVRDALMLGGRIEKESDRLAEQERQQYRDRTLEAGALGAARGISFGLSDYALQDVGGYTEEELSKLKEYNSGAGTLGEIAGVVGTAGFGLVKGVAGLGQATERVIARGLAKEAIEEAGKYTAKEFAKRIVPKAAGSAVEGAFYGTGHLISESALGHAEFNAENVVTYAGLGSLLGGGLGGTFALFPAGAGYIRNVLSKKTRGPLLAKVNARRELFQKPFSPEGAAMRDAFLKKKDIVGIKKEVNAFLKDTDRLVKELEKLAENPDARIWYRLKRGNRLEELKNQLKLISDANGRLKKTDPDDILAAVNAADQIHDLANELDVMMRAIGANTDVKGLVSMVGKGAKSAGEQLNLQRLENALVAESADAMAGVGGDIIKGAIGARNIGRVGVEFGRRAGVAEIGGMVADPLLGGMLGAAKGIYQVYKNPIQALKVLAAIEGAIIKNKAVIDRRLTNFLNQGSRIQPVRSVGSLVDTTNERSIKKRPTTNMMNIMLLKGSRRNETREQAFDRISTDVDELSSDPQRVMDMIQKNMENAYDIAPDTMLGVKLQAIKMIDFLRSQLPRDPTPLPSYAGREWKPSNSELARFERILKTVIDPISVMDDMMMNRASQEQFTILAQIHPEMLGIMRETAIERLRRDKPLSFSARMQLSMLLGQPLDPSLTAEGLAGLQGSFANNEEQSGSGGSKGRKSKLASIMQSESQRMEEDLG